MSFDVVPLGDQIEEYISIAGESLLSDERDLWQLYLDRIGIENFRTVQQSGKLVGGLAFYRMGQWFGGHELSTAGFSGVAVSPSDRGSNACRTMLERVLAELNAEAMPLASLYASTQSLYRKVGFEHAGGRWQYSLPMSSLTHRSRDLPVHRFKSPSIEALEHVAKIRGENGNGQLRRSNGLWERVLQPYDGSTATYLIGDAEKPDGYAVFKSGTRASGVPQPLVSMDMAANTKTALERLMTLVYDHRSMNGSFQWCGGPNDPFLLFAKEQWLDVKAYMRWMLRIVNLPAALIGRGYPPVAGELHLEVDDPLLPSNSGRWVLEVKGGSANLQRGGNGHLRINIQNLAPLYSSLYSASELARLGKIEFDDDQQLRLADMLFAGPQPWTVDLF